MRSRSHPLPGHRPVSTGSSSPIQACVGLQLPWESCCSRAEDMTWSRLQPFPNTGGAGSEFRALRRLGVSLANRPLLPQVARSQMPHGRRFWRCCRALKRHGSEG